MNHMLQGSANTINYASLFRSSPEPKLLLDIDDPKFTIVDQTDAHAKMTGIFQDKAVGHPVFEVFPDVSEKNLKTGISDLAEGFRDVIRTKKANIQEIFRYDIPDGNNGYSKRYWRTTNHPVFDDNNRLRYVLQVATDATAEVKSIEQLNQVQATLQDALEIGKVGSWVWDVDRDIVVADPNLAGMFGLGDKAVSAGVSIAHFTRAMHPDDRPRVEAAIRTAIQQEDSFEEEYRTIGPNKEIRWVLARGRIEKRHGTAFFPGVVVDITEQHELQTQVELAREQDVLNRRASKLLQDRNDELEAISRTKDEFVALASHQLRTPATAVKQYLGMVLQGYVGDISPLQNEMLDKAFESNERQIQIINQILNAARADTGRLIMTPQALDICMLARGISEEMRPFLEQRRHSFIVHLPNTAVPVLADTGYLRMAIENLLHNACIYTAEGGTIVLQLEKVAGKNVRLSITDNGVGIKKADQSKLFVKFSRIHNPLSVQAGGSGIGLYLTAEIIRLHGGSVTVASKINKGTTFDITLPLADKIAAAKPAK